MTKIPAKLRPILLFLPSLLVLSSCGDKKSVAPTIPAISWQQTNFPYSGAVYSLAINSSGHIFAGTSGSGIFRSTDSGANWTAVNTGLTNLDVLSLAINFSGDIFAGTAFGGGVFHSTDNGDTWTAVNTGLTEALVNHLAINTSGHIFAGTTGIGIFRSTNNGDNWTQSGLLHVGISALTIDSRGYLFASIGRVVRSVDNGSTWTMLDAPLNLPVTSLAINSNGDIFSGTIHVSQIDGPTYGGVFRSTDDGVSWTAAKNGLSTTYTTSALTINSNGHIFAGTDGDGVFRSTDNGANWTVVNTGLSNTYVNSLIISPTGKIFAATHNGVFRSQ